MPHEQNETEHRRTFHKGVSAKPAFAFLKVPSIKYFLHESCCQFKILNALQFQRLRIKVWFYANVFNFTPIYSINCSSLVSAYLKQYMLPLNYTLLSAMLWFSVRLLSNSMELKFRLCKNSFYGKFHSNMGIFVADMRLLKATLQIWS